MCRKLPSDGQQLRVQDKTLLDKLTRQKRSNRMVLTCRQIGVTDRGLPCSQHIQGTTLSTPSFIQQFRIISFQSTLAHQKGQVALHYERYGWWFIHLGHCPSWKREREREISFKRVGTSTLSSDVSLVNGQNILSAGDTLSADKSSPI